MAELDKQKELIAKISENLVKIEEGQLSLQELDAYVQATQELYERAVVIRYKAMETAVKGEESETERRAESGETEQKTEQRAESEENAFEPKKEEKEQEEGAGIEFRLFDEEELNEKVTEELTEASTETGVLTQNDFTTLFSEIGATSKNQIGFSKLETLKGSFGLNDRLHYINELFDGSSEAFSDAILKLDTQSDLEAAKNYSAQLATENEWELESDTVEEFIQMICRRHA